MDPLKEFKKIITQSGSTLYNPVFNFAPISASLNWYGKEYYAPYSILPVNPIFSLSNKENLIWYVTLEQFKPFTKDFAKKFILKEDVSGFFKQYEENRNKINQMYEKYIVNKTNIKDEEGVIKELNVLLEAECKTNAAGWFSIYMDRSLIEEIIQETDLSISPLKLDEIIEKSSDPKEGSFDIRSKLIILDLIIQNKNLGEIYENVKFIFAGFAGIGKDDLDREEIKKTFTDFISGAKSAQEEKEIFIQEIKNNQIKLEEYRKRLSEDERMLSEYIEVSSTMKDALRDYIGKTIVLIFKFAETITPNTLHPYIKYITVQELSKGSGYLQAIEEDVVEREQGFCFIMKPDQIPYQELMTNKVEKIKQDLQELFLNQNGFKKDVESSIKGQVASKGFVKGRVVKITDFESQRNKMQKDAVLVTGMTRPEFVPIMKIASAIVTDEGGITCHAAIVTRELGKPCIIGTKIATQVLKDGDVVEVDAEKGIIRIIN